MPLAKGAFVRTILHLARNPTRKQVMSDRNATIVGDTGVETGVDTISLMAEGNAVHAATRFTAVYTRRAGVWKALALHLVATKRNDARH